MEGETDNFDWFSGKVLLQQQRKNCTSGKEFSTDGNIIKSEETVKHLRVILHYKHFFNPHISTLCKKAATMFLKDYRSLFALKKKDSCSKSRILKI